MYKNYAICDIRKWKYPRNLQKCLIYFCKDDYEREFIKSYKHLDKKLLSLPELYQDIINRLFKRHMNMNSIAKDLEYSRERIRQLFNESIDKLRRMILFESDKYSNYIEYSELSNSAIQHLVKHNIHTIYDIQQIFKEDSIILTDLSEKVLREIIDVLGIHFSNHSIDDLSIRTLNILHKNNITNSADLKKFIQEKSIDSLLKEKGVGKKTKIELYDFIKVVQKG